MNLWFVFKELWTSKASRDGDFDLGRVVFGLFITNFPEKL